MNDITTQDPSNVQAADAHPIRTCKYADEAGHVLGMADTNGWDTVYVVKADVVNASMRRHFEPLVGTHAFRMKELLESDLYDLQIDAEFGAWQIARGGAGNKIHLQLPIVSGKATVQGKKEKIVDISGTTAIVEVSLGYHAPPEIDPAKPLYLQLKIIGDRAAPAIATALDAQPADGKPAAAHDEIRVLELKGPNFESSMESTICGGIKDWLQNRKDLFDYVFLSVDIAQEAAQGHFEWIKPTTVGYAVTDILDKDGEVVDTLFAVLGMTQFRKLDHASSSVPVSAIPLDKDANAAFLIGSHLILDKFVRPRLHTLFEGASPGDFVSPKGNALAIQNQNPVKLKLELDPEWYSGNGKHGIATIPAKNFTVKAENRSMVTSFQNVRLPYGGSEEIDIVLSYECDAEVGLDEHDHFAFRAQRTQASLSAQPNQEKMAKETLKTVGWSIVAQIGTAIVFHGLGKIAGKAASALKGGSNVVARTAGQEAAVVERNVQQVMAAEIEQAGKVGQDAALRVESTGAKVWRAVGSATRTGSVGVLEFLQGGLTNTLVIMMVGQMAGSLYGERGTMDLISALHEDPGSMKGMTEFADHCVSPILWPHTNGATLLSAGLNNAFTLAFRIEA
ncbi:Clostridium P-47 protein [Bordetella ansorpii]|uniref:Clostridium P-47 protein n=1 Tax=Bordetella ansorpii TaxID=288768 RepID=A0A157SKW5_9BORD|nr:TULIP family P47-like protein [Bordetella ansorpii]SAI71067.1 Clostridium P-47 protein [Bordetella ansorpii]